MDSKRKISLGFDLRTNPSLQPESPLQGNQHLVPFARNPISADPSVWMRPDGIDALCNSTMLDFLNPLTLATSINLLVTECNNQRIRIRGLSPVCITSDETNVIALSDRFGSDHFENLKTEDEVLSLGWKHLGFDVVDLSGLISGLKGCGYVEPSWSKLRNYFASGLNEVGLFIESSVASQFAEVRGLQIRDHAPFVVVGLLIASSTGILNLP